MAMVVMIGCEWGHGKEFDNIGGSGIQANTPVRTGNYSLRVSYNMGPVTKSIAQLSECFLQFGLYSTLDGGTVTFFALQKDNTDIISITKNPVGQLELRSGWGGTLLATSQTILAPSIWYVVELHFKMADSGGIIELRIDGNAECTFIGDTKPGADTYVNRLRWEIFGAHGAIWIDDIIVNDTTGLVNNSWPGGLKLYLLKPAGDAGQNEWTASPGPTHYTGVDEVPPLGTDNIKTDQNDLVELFTLTDLPAEARSVKAVALDFNGLKGSTVAPTRVAQVISLGGTSYEQADQDLPMAQGLVRKIVEQNPAGGGWSVAAVNALASGVKSRP